MTLESWIPVGLFLLVAMMIPTGLIALGFAFGSRARRPDVRVVVCEERAAGPRLATLTTDAQGRRCLEKRAPPGVVRGVGNFGRTDIAGLLDQHGWVLNRVSPIRPVKS